MHFSFTEIDYQQQHWNKFYNEFKELNFDNQVNLNRLKKAKKQLDYFYQTIYIHLKTKEPLTELVPKNKLKTFYRTKEKIRKAFYTFKTDLNHLLPKSTILHKVRQFYSYADISEMCDTYYSYLNFHNKTSLWVEFKRNKHKHLSLRIFLKYINNDNRALQQENRARIRHPRRKHVLPLGLIQMDVKVFDKSENPFTNRKLYLLDFIDEQSKFAYGEFIESQSTDEIVNVVKKARKYFRANGIDIQCIRTDNWMSFKKTNFVHSGLFQKYLLNNNIRHEFIPLGEPECNGVIERFHRTITQRILFKNKKFCTFWKSKNCLKWMIIFLQF